MTPREQREPSVISQCLCLCGALHAGEASAPSRFQRVQRRKQACGGKKTTLANSHFFAAEDFQRGCAAVAFDNFTVYETQVVGRITHAHIDLQVESNNGRGKQSQCETF